MCEVEIRPSPLLFAGKEITFEAAWLEKRPNEGYALCFRLDRGKEIFIENSDLCFVRGELGASFSQRIGKGWIQFIEFLESDDLSSIRASLITSWKEERPKNIQFIKVGQ